jgi:hypothetical protein
MHGEPREQEGRLCISMRPEWPAMVCLPESSAPSRLPAAFLMPLLMPLPCLLPAACCLLLQDSHHAAPGLRGAPVCQVAGAA